MPLSAGRKLATVLARGNGYLSKVVSIAAANLISYLPLSESAGTVDTDYSGRGNHAAYTASNITYGVSGIGDGRTAVQFTGAASINLMAGSNSLPTNFNGQAFSFGIWLLCDTAVWTDGTEDEVLKITVDASNSITIRKPTAGSAFNFIYVAGGTTKTISPAYTPDGAWHYYTLTISLSNDQMIAYRDGVQTGSTATGLGTWAGTPTVMVVGAQNVAGSTPWNGKLQHPHMLTRALTGQEVLSLSSPFDLGSTPGFWALGDSKTYGTGDDNPPADGANGWPYLLAALKSWGEKPARSGKSGWTVAMFAASIAADVKAAGGWEPVVVYVALGTNDIEPLADPLVAGTWQANLGTILDTIHTRWPNAQVYVDRVWRRYNNGQLDALNDTWIPAVLSTRSAWAHLGIDERLILPGSDDGATYTVDGIHPNHAGYVLLAQAKAQL